MSECWQDGDLRAALDRELPLDEMKRLTAHLAQCPDCSIRQRELGRRAARVSIWMDDLAETAPGPVRIPRRRGAWRKWAVAGLAAAAGLVIAMIPLARKPVTVVTVAPPSLVQSAPPVMPVTPQPDAVPEVVPVMAPSRVVPSRPALRVRRGKAPQVEQFIALDNEPFETGLVVRVALGPDEVQADVVFSPDGRARAYRLVNEKLN
jgi:hypothetical protein